MRSGFQIFDTGIKLCLYGGRDYEIQTKPYDTHPDGRDDDSALRFDSVRGTMQEDFASAA